VIPGIIAAIGVDRVHVAPNIVQRIGVGMLSVCLVASSNYVVNEVLDATSDRAHPVKFARPVPSGKVNVPLAYVQWLALMVVGVWLGFQVSKRFAATMIVLWVMGCLYNIRPFRSKELPYVDVLSESVNNPLRLLAGWFIVGTSSVAPASLLLSYWMVGCYFMAMKRFAVAFIALAACNPNDSGSTLVSCDKLAPTAASAPMGWSGSVFTIAHSAAYGV